MANVYLQVIKNQQESFYSINHFIEKPTAEFDFKEIEVALETQASCADVRSTFSKHFSCLQKTTNAQGIVYKLEPENFKVDPKYRLVDNSGFRTIYNTVEDATALYIIVRF